MQIRKTHIFTFLMIPVIFILTYALVWGFPFIKGQGILSFVENKEKIARSEKAVQEQLKLIREAQKAFYTVNNRYTGNWDSLISFLDTGKIYNIAKREEIIQRPADQSHLGDSVKVTLDTLGVDNPGQKLFPKDKFPTFDYHAMRNIPGKPGKQFVMQAAYVEKGGIMLSAIEVKDPFPVDNTRSEDSENRKRRFLRFGSLTDVTLTGNWED